MSGLHRPTALGEIAKPAGEKGLVGKGTWKKLTRVGRVDDMDGPIRHALRLGCVEGDEQMKLLARVEIGDREDCGMVGQVEVGLIDSDLSVIAGTRLFQPFGGDFLEGFRSSGFCLPKTGIADTGDGWAVYEHAIRRSGEPIVKLGETEGLARLLRLGGQLETSVNEPKTGEFFAHMAEVELP